MSEFKSEGDSYASFYKTDKILVPFYETTASKTFSCYIMNRADLSVDKNF